MPILRIRSEATRYTIYGALFGALFPLLSWLILRLVSRNIDILFGVICTAPFFLGLFARFAGIRQDRIHQINRGLESQVAERTRSIQSLLDVSGQGFLSFGPDYRVGSEFSRECATIFGGPVGGKDIRELLYGSGGSADFTSGLDLYFAGSARPEVIFDLLEPELRVGGKILRIEFRAVDSRRVMTIITDVTQERSLQERVRGEDQRRNLLIKAVSNKASFGAFLAQAQELLAALSEAAKDGEGLLREVHTFKGNAALFGFRRTQDAAHELENHLADSIALGQPAQPQPAVSALSAAFSEELGLVRETLGQDWIRESDSVLIPLGDYRRIERHVLRHHPADLSLRTTLTRYRHRPLAQLLSHFPQLAQELAAQRGKRVAPVLITGGAEQVDPEEFRELVASFVHLLRNVVDHGIEPPGEREALGKRPEGTIRIDIVESRGEIGFCFGDDGRGIALEEVERRAREAGFIQGLRKPPERDLLAFLFRDGFSTAREVTAISGRGAGLAAVREAVQRRGGRIAVWTRRGRGSRFRITLPRKSHKEGED